MFQTTNQIIVPTMSILSFFSTGFSQQNTASAAMEEHQVHPQAHAGLKRAVRGGPGAEKKKLLNLKNMLFFPIIEDQDDDDDDDDDDDIDVDVVDVVDVVAVVDVDVVVVVVVVVVVLLLLLVIVLVLLVVVSMIVLVLVSCFFFA